MNKQRRSAEETATDSTQLVTLRRINSVVKDAAMAKSCAEVHCEYIATWRLDHVVEAMRADRRLRAAIWGSTSAREA